MCAIKLITLTSSRLNNLYVISAVSGLNLIAWSLPADVACRLLWYRLAEFSRPSGATTHLALPHQTVLVIFLWSEFANLAANVLEKKKPFIKGIANSSQTITLGLWNICIICYSVLCTSRRPMCILRIGEIYCRCVHRQLRLAGLKDFGRFYFLHFLVAYLISIPLILFGYQNLTSVCISLKEEKNFGKGTEN